MAQAPGARPPQLHLGDQARPDQVAAALAHWSAKGERVLPEGRQALGQVAQDGA